MSELEITVEDLHARLAQASRPFLLDVREPWEHAIAALPEAQLIPMSRLPDHLGTLSGDREVVVYCHHGVRSLYATVFLREHGVPSAYSLRGGIDAWSAVIDPGVPRY